MPARHQKASRFVLLKLPDFRKERKVMSVFNVSLEAMCLKAKANVYASIYGFDNETTEDMFMAAHDKAYVAGMDEFTEQSGSSMLTSVPALRRAFDKGYESCRMLDEMANCSDCKNERGDPCMYHS